jgi:SNF2 family DNA or RNA helicase
MLSVLNDAELQAKPSAELTRWRNALLREPTQLPGLPAFLRPYQGRGVAWLAHMLEAGTHPLLADEMGLGKTLQVLALLLQKPLDAPALIACPASVVPVWQEEIRRFFPSTPVRILERGKVWHPDDPPAIWLTSYAQLRQHRALLEKITFSHAVLDEAQFIKNPDAKATQACMAIQARHRIALTGTPIENHPDDLWSIFHFLMPGLLGKRHAFETKLNRDPDFLSHITCQITPFVLRRTKQSVAPELPPKVIMSLPCPMGKTQHELYRKIVEEGLATLGNDSPDALLSARSMSFLSLLTRLRQAACDPGLLPTHDALPPLASGKITTLLERLENILASGQKAVVFSQFVSLLERVGTALAERFPKTPLFRLTGQTQHREVPVAAFQNRAGASVMLVSLRAGGTGITLHSAEYVFLLDPWWNPAVEAQAIDRVHRIGQGNTTFVYRMIAPNTVEARVEALKETKQELFSKIIGDLPDMSDWSKHFPSLRALIE